MHSAASFSNDFTHSTAESTTQPVLAYSSDEPARDEAWIAYLRALRGVAISQFVANNAERIWRRLRPLACGIAVPDAAVTEGGGLFMSWDRGVHHLEIEILPNGRFEWFYRNRSTDYFAGEYDYPVPVLPANLVAQFRLVAEHV